MEGIDFDETFAQVVILESVTLLLAITCHIGFKLFHMDVKSAFLIDILHEETYVEKPKDLKTLNFLAKFTKIRLCTV